MKTAVMFTLLACLSIAFASAKDAADCPGFTMASPKSAGKASHCTTVASTERASSIEDCKKLACGEEKATAFGYKGRSCYVKKCDPISNLRLTSGWGGYDIYTIAFCPVPNGYGRLATEATTSFKPQSFDHCAESAYNRTSSWISYDSSSKNCKLYGDADITSGVIKGNTGTVKHYSISACQLNGIGVSSEHKDCLKFRTNSRPHTKNSYSGFTCMIGPYGVKKPLDASDIDLRKEGGPLSKITIYYTDVWGLSLKTHYGPNKVGNLGTNTEARTGTYTVKPAKGDCITKIEVKTGQYTKLSQPFEDIFQLTFFTRNGEKFGPYGKDDGTKHEAKGPEGTCLSFLDTIYGSWLNGVAFIFEPYSNFV